MVGLIKEHNPGLLQPRGIVDRVIQEGLVENYFVSCERYSYLANLVFIHKPSREPTDTTFEKVIDLSLLLSHLHLPT